MYINSNSKNFYKINYLTKYTFVLIKVYKPGDLGGQSKYELVT